MVVKVAAGKFPDIRLPLTQSFFRAFATFKVMHQCKKVPLREMPEIDINKAEVAARAFGIRKPGLF